MFQDENMYLTESKSVSGIACRGVTLVINRFVLVTLHCCNNLFCYHFFLFMTVLEPNREPCCIPGMLLMKKMMQFNGSLIYITK